jgi:hypothetical protein
MPLKRPLGSLGSPVPTVSFPLDQRGSGGPGGRERRSAGMGWWAASSLPCKSATAGGLSQASIPVPPQVLLIRPTGTPRRRCRSRAKK